MSRIKLKCLDFIYAGRYYSLAAQNAFIWPPYTEISGLRGFGLAMEIFTKIRQSPQQKKHIYSLAVTLMAFGLFAQAIHAKNSDYLPTAPHSTRYSTTIKIANLARHVNVAPATVAIVREIVPIPPPQFTVISDAPEVRCRELSAQIRFRPLRSPPANS
jgi:hypothetical protein